MSNASRDDTGFAAGSASMCQPGRVFLSEGEWLMV
jgi:hypothetical protein